MTRRSRREVLAGTGAALATALAGCGGLDAVRRGGDDAVVDDRGALADLAGRTPPTPPNAFPVSIPASAFERHRSRIATLLDGVPESPAIPNEVLAERLAADRADVEERLRAATGEGADPDRHRERPEPFWPGGPTPRDRLDRLRGVRADAASVYVARLAATGRLDRESLQSVRDSLRSAALDFRRSWSYAGAGPLEALLVHQHVEDLLERVSTAVHRHPSAPDRPQDDPFAVGEIAASLEGARAALVDADAIRRGYRESIAEPTPYRSTIEATAERLVDTYRITSLRADVHDYLDLDEPPFERSIRDTPAGELYRRALDAVGEDFVDAGSTPRPAYRCLRATVGLAGVETFGTVVERIDAGDYGVPESATRVVEAYEDAVDALKMVWRGEPRGIRRRLDWPATSLVAYRMRDLREEVERGDGGGVSTDTVNELYSGLAYAYHYATYVPPAADYLRDALRDR